MMMNVAATKAEKLREEGKRKKKIKRVETMKKWTKCAQSSSSAAECPVSQIPHIPVL